MIQAPQKLPIEQWVLAVDFTAQLAAGDSGSSGTATVSGGSIEVADAAGDGAVVSFTLTGGAHGEKGVVLVSLTTTAGEVLAEEVVVPIG